MLNKALKGAGLFLLFGIISFSFYINAVKKNKLIQKCVVSRWAWSSYCDHVYSDYNDQSGLSYKLDPSKIKRGDTVFFTLATCRKFFKEVHPFIKKPYIIISLYVIDKPDIERYINDPKIIAWFGMCPEEVHSKKFRMIPLGINLDQLTIKESNNLRAVSKTKKIYMNFVIHENRGLETELRRKAHTFFKNKSFCVVGQQKSVRDYMKDMARCAFAVSPTGDMDDCFRHYESMVVGSIPLISKYNHNGVPCAVIGLLSDLPAIFVDDYTQITESFLLEKHQEMSKKKYNLKKLYMSYWMSEIKKIKRAFFSLKGK